MEFLLALHIGSKVSNAAVEMGGGDYETAVAFRAGRIAKEDSRIS